MSVIWFRWHFFPSLIIFFVNPNTHTARMSLKIDQMLLFLTKQSTQSKVRLIKSYYFKQGQSSATYFPTCFVFYSSLILFSSPHLNNVCSPSGSSSVRCCQPLSLASSAPLSHRFVRYTWQRIQRSSHQDTVVFSSRVCEAGERLMSHHAELPCPGRFEVRADRDSICMTLITSYEM